MGNRFVVKGVTATIARDPTAQTNSCSDLLRNCGRTGPHVVNMDFSVFKTIPVSRILERFKIQFRAEMFNGLNHANFAPPNPFEAGAEFDQDGSVAGGGG